MMSADKFGDNFDVTVGVDSSVGQLSAGIHRARCKEAKIEPNKARDGHNLVLTMESMEAGQEGRTARTWVSLKETARWKLTETLMAFGAEPEKDKTGAPKVRMTRKMFIGARVRIHISVEDYEGEDRAQIQRILPWDSKTTAGGPPTAEKPRKVKDPVPEPEDDDDGIPSPEYGDAEGLDDDSPLPDDEAAVAEEDLPF
jgi:hypothetical protein